ncbi:uncharacterized protein LOC124392017 isoform X2 [Silurus meridionalis]|uniref:Uncharacterized protein n=2 Tax=Silurus meridionalis TaxID=175797 RepID=A0A8T0B9N9_SILME|nr:uncharacterized protein LOC124392017 isoform X2 [Silurus meridionalis]XP_046714677.1 uncharacterized protein LOC124392017 isoform X2 [Silurus meridionalis]KAF7702351.1 hypothetical protein HF521_001634 [Silurus meridionalis]
MTMTERWITGLTHLLIFTMIYHVLSVLADKEWQPCSQNFTQVYCPSNITVEVKAMTDVNNCGENVNMICNTNLPLNLTCGFKWNGEQNQTDSNNQSINQIISNKKAFICTVLSPCGNFSSSSYEQKCKDQLTIVLLICGIGAILIILVFGMTMKIILKRGEVQRQARRQQRQAMQSNDSTATTTSYW